MAKPIRTVATRNEDILLVCRKCMRKLDGGFGPDGDLPLDKALKRELGLGKDRKARVRLVRAPCFDLCPKGAVTLVKGSAPEKLYVVPKGADTADVAAALGLDAC
jgi:hypothetical protein